MIYLGSCRVLSRTCDCLSAAPCLPLYTPVTSFQLNSAASPGLASRRLVVYVWSDSQHISKSRAHHCTEPDLWIVGNCTVLSTGSPVFQFIPLVMWPSLICLIFMVHVMFSQNLHVNVDIELWILNKSPLPRVERMVRGRTYNSIFSEDYRDWFSETQDEMSKVN